MCAALRNSIRPGLGPSRSDTARATVGGSVVASVLADERSTSSAFARQVSPRSGSAIEVGRRLPGQPDPRRLVGTRRRRCATIAGSRRRARPAGNPAPYSAVVRGAHPSGMHACVGVTRAVPAARRSGQVWCVRHRSRAPPHTQTDVRRQGPSRERDDRRPGPQRPRTRVRVPGSVRVPDLLAVERPSRPRGTSSAPSREQLRPGTGWAELIEATFPPGSVTGAPKLAAAIDPHRPASSPCERGPLLRSRSAGSTPTAPSAELNVAIRTFWIDGDRLCTSGPVAGSPWDSDRHSRVGRDGAQGEEPAGGRVTPVRNPFSTKYGS